MRHSLDSPEGYRIKAVATFTGLSPHVIRKWEERYQFLIPYRSENGYRLYFEDDIQFLMYLNAQIEAGKSVGQLGKIGGAQLRREMNEGPVHVFGIPQAHYKQAITLIQAARRLNRSITEETIQNLVYRLGLEQAVQQVFFPVLKAIGDLWHGGKVSITGEHMVTQAIRQHLVETLHKEKESPRTIGHPRLCASGFSRDRSDDCNIDSSGSGVATCLFGARYRHRPYSVSL